MPERLAANKLQFNFSQESIGELDALRIRIEAPSRADTVRYSLRTLQWIFEEIDKGNRICIKEDDEFRELVFMFPSGGGGR